MSIRRIIALLIALTFGSVACGSGDTQGSNGDDDSTVAAESTDGASEETLVAPSTEGPEPDDSVPADAAPAVFDADAPNLSPSSAPSSLALIA